MSRIQLDVNRPCPCGSGKLLKACCALEGLNSVRKVPATVTPRPPRTGYSHPSCYLSHTGDCSKKLSAEHYVSAALLRALGDKLLVGGMPWLRNGETKVVGINSLTAKVLCTRHNEALSPLDGEAARLFRTIKLVAAELDQKSLARRPKQYILSGEDLERWMAKLLMGTFRGKILARNAQPLSTTHSLNLSFLKQVFAGALAYPRGLWIKAAVG